MIKENLEEVKNNINKKCLECGIDANNVTLIAVSKTKPVSMIEEVYSFGVRDFGENKVQELVSKYEVLPKDIKWHLIGHLQTNKVKYIVDKAYLIHSVDSLKLANEINKESLKRNIVSNILIEVNVALEESKFGVRCDEVENLIRDIAKLSNVKVKGLMTVAPYVADSIENKPIFAELKQLFIDIKSKNIDNVNMEFLSMGMSNDYEIAVEEGATFVRVGTNIFGERDYSI